MLRRRRNKRHWRSGLKESSLPLRVELVNYCSLIDKIVSVAVGEEVAPRDILLRFRQGFNQRSNAEMKTQDLRLLIDVYRNIIPSLDREDLAQQCYIYLLELWDFFKIKWKRNKNKVFYDYARSYLSRWMGNYIAMEIRKYTSEDLREQEELSYEMDVEEKINLDLGWVFLYTKNGKIGKLSVKQKYLLYLRFNKDMSIVEIADLIGQHNKEVEKEFSAIKQKLGD